MEIKQSFATRSKNYCSTASTSQTTALSRTGGSMVRNRPEEVECRRKCIVRRPISVGGGARRSISTSTPSGSFSTSVSYTPPVYMSRLDQSPAPRRQTLTVGESRAIDDMFASIFNAAQRQDDSSLLPETQETGHSTLFSKWASTIPTKQQWSRSDEEILDLKKEEIELCQNDQELFTWVVKEFFENPSLHPEVRTISQSNSNDNAIESKKLPAFAYSLLLSRVMRVMRTRYENPHLALALFEHARHVSASSYVMFCGTAAYNELIETRWSSFRDLQGVCEAVEEMKLNQVRVDTRTTRLIENIRREVGEQNLWHDEGFGESHSNVLALLNRIETACWSGASSVATLRRDIVTKPKSEWLGDSEAWKLPSTGDGDYLEFV
ncbi:hypothetical protein FRC19_008899 [Serendipita sp. 401]|nr:hypothetical protein FRC19_008899 [Serendipita sp. 401]KAG9056663.1 hypothetical protein FS842_009965 [Serendipita sp. 407]